MVPWIANFQLNAMDEKDSHEIVENLLVMSVKFSSLYPKGFSFLFVLFLFGIFFILSFLTPKNRNRRTLGECSNIRF